MSASGASEDAFVNVDVAQAGEYAFTNNSASDVFITLDLVVDLIAASSVDAIGSETATARAFVDILGSGDSGPLSILSSISVASDIFSTDQDSFSLSNPISFWLAAGGSYTLNMTVGFVADVFSPATAVPLPPAALLLPFGLAGLMRASRRKKTAAAA